MGTAPLLDTLTVCGALGRPGCPVAKLRPVGLMLNAGGCNPVPLRATVWICGWVVKSVMVSVPVWLPTAVGANWTLTMPIEWAAICETKLLVASNRALAAIAMLVRGRSPRLVIVTCVWLLTVETCPTPVEGNASVVEFRMIGGHSLAGAAQLHNLRSCAVSQREESRYRARCRGCKCNSSDLAGIAAGQSKRAVQVLGWKRSKKWWGDGHAGNWNCRRTAVGYSNRLRCGRHANPRIAEVKRGGAQSYCSPQARQCRSGPSVICPP